jgi:hypothetical protein
MSKHISDAVFYELPSGARVHPSRLIHRDGTLMWKHALLFNGELNVPTDQAVEAHIVKTAQRLEELNSWVSQGLDPWECLTPIGWYLPSDNNLKNGITVHFVHATHNICHTYERLLPHIQPHEVLELRNSYLCFQRC